MFGLASFCVGNILKKSVVEDEQIYNIVLYNMPPDTDIFQSDSDS